jgi:hypothetical protein
MKSKILVGFAVLVTTLGLSGCISKPKSKLSAEQFRGADPHLAGDVAELKRLCPVGTSARTVSDLLGGQCRLVHYYGPLLHADSRNTGHSAERQDDWALEYETPHGKICLWLKWPSGYDGSDLDYAVLSRVDLDSPGF